MADDWQFYIGRVDGVPASIFLNMVLTTTTLKPNHPILGSISIEMTSPREDGLSSSEEAATLYKIEEALTNGLVKLDAIYAGRITKSGHRAFYFYVKTEQGFSDLVEINLTAFPRYHWKCITQIDSDWDFYKDVLYPSNSARHSIENRKVISALKDAGDTAAVPRELFHCSWFITDAARLTFAKWAESAGFSVTMLAPVANKSGKRWGAAFERIDSVQQDALDLLTTELERQTVELDGDYDGWECEIVSAPN